MEKLPTIEMTELNNSIITSYNFQDVFSITDTDSSLISKEYSSDDIYSSPIRLNGLILVLTLAGNAKISLDYTPYTIHSNSFIIIMPTHIFQIAEFSQDYKGRLIVIDKSFLEECHLFPQKEQQKRPPMMSFMQLRKNPYTPLDLEETIHLDKHIHLLKQKMQLRTHSFHKEVIQNTFVGFLLELGNIFMGKNDNITVPTLSRKEEIFNQFLQLLFEHVKKEHIVTFYAEKLFITPQYLSLVLKGVTGRSANKWIDEALMVEARILLKTPQTTVQEVADKLNFSDQSTFGKFFKKHMGVSPMEYRKS